MNLKKQLFSNHILAVSIGLVYLWFGMLKYFPQVSPAEDLAKNTITAVTFGLIPGNVSIILLAIWETAVGLMLLLNVYRKAAVILALIHITFTFLPLFLFPQLSFTCSPYCFTLLGQYIFKNIIIIAALVTLLQLPEIKREQVSTGY